MACSPKCAVEYVRQQKEKAALKKQAEEKRKERVKKAQMRERLETIPELIKKAQAAFNAYIRARDKGKPCISCGTAWRENFQACHYVPAGRSNKLRFDEDNVHGGCVRCNMYESGNLRGYRIGLIQRIGVERVEQMETDYEIRKWDKDELRALIALYRKKTRELKSNG
ncbi:recombination protein NinG [Neisseria arctica]|nr:recombination protein NinG [Neisseria arctica]UOO87475.1 recombination protein NinG [Neisseria arctica]